MRGTLRHDAASGGTVFDIGYQSYTGRREGRNRGRLAVFKNGVRTALGLGRGARAKILPWSFVTLLMGIALVMVLIAGATQRMAGPGVAAVLNLPSHADYYRIVAVIIFVFAALVAPELLCRDRRERTISLYLVRPLTGTDYVFARYAAFLTVVLAAVWIPQIILFFGLAIDDPAPGKYLAAHWRDVPRFLLAGLVMATYTTGLALLTASFTNRRAYASVFLVGLFVITAPFTAGLARMLDGPAGQWLSMFDLTNIPLYVNDIIFGEVSKVMQNAPARQLSETVHIGWYLAWTLLPAAGLWWRYRRMSP